ncbi:glycosyltransferase [Microbacterium sp. BK668]|uniref:glycosyltransferase family 4 protein n=1 Tax=Microbacterium sp. BK668 TaxID=2512118 RepID=UPI00105C332E|nr:glycosyltransferase [Microbacterium sp. BK668]TDN88386.1 glycosyltransferase involved in cell wall biosynthesis [Microbacterium sp. BK668]
MPRHLAIAYDCLFPYTTGGGERLYRSYAAWMAERGCSVDYLTSVQWDQPGVPHEDDFRIVPVTGRLRLYDAHGVRRSAAALAFAWGLFRGLRARRRAYDAVLVSGLPVLNVFAARAALVGTGTEVVVDYLEVWGRAQWREYAGRITGTVAWLLQRAAVALTPIATCHSQLTARQLSAEGLRGRLLVSPGLLDGDSGVAASAGAAEPAYVLYAGRHIPDKRVETLPAAVARARATLPGLRLVVLGSGPSSSAVDAAIGDVDGAGWIDRPGFVTDERLLELMAGASALVNPSRREGYGLVVVEASAHGTPVVLVDDSGNAATELVEEGVNGFVAASDSPEDLAAAIVAAVSAGTALRRSTRAWYEEAVRTRTVERTVDGILAALDAAPSDSGEADDRRAPIHEGPK